MANTHYLTHISYRWNWKILTFLKVFRVQPMKLPWWWPLLYVLFLLWWKKPIKLLSTNCPRSWFWKWQSCKTNPKLYQLLYLCLLILFRERMTWQLLWGKMLSRWRRKNALSHIVNDSCWPYLFINNFINITDFLFYSYLRQNHERIKNIKLIIAYDGTDYAGWQRQKIRKQYRCNEDNLRKISGEKI